MESQDGSVWVCLNCSEEGVNNWDYIGFYNHDDFAYVKNLELPTNHPNYCYSVSEGLNIFDYHDLYPDGGYIDSIYFNIEINDVDILSLSVSEPANGDPPLFLDLSINKENPNQILMTGIPNLNPIIFNKSSQTNLSCD